MKDTLQRLRDEMQDRLDSAMPSAMFSTVRRWKTELDALLAVSPPKKDQEDLARVDTMGDSHDSRTASENELIRASVLANLAHYGQIDKAGHPYIQHVERVAAAVDGNDAKTVALLHDVCEDSPVHLSMLRGFGFSASVVASVDLLTRREPYNYLDYISRLTESGNQIALTVKRADLLDHLNPACPDGLRGRYETALMLVDEALAADAVARPVVSES